MNEAVSKFLSTKAVLVITIFVYSLLQGFFLSNDFWQDEIYTLEHFVFRSWKVVFTDYHSTNNHIAFNVLLKSVSTLLNIDNVETVIERPYLLRLVPYLFSVLSLVFFFRGAGRHYGQRFAATGLSVFCTTIVIIDFGAQLRGYSMSIFLTIVQYFLFSDIIKGSVRKSNFVALFFVTCLSLLCLPTNIYLIATYLLFCLIMLFFPSVSLFFIKSKLTRENLFLVSTVISIATILTLLYYARLLKLQPENPLITSFNLFRLKNLLQALAIFFHFTDYRYYFFFLLSVWLAIYFKNVKYAPYSGILFPGFLFFIPFLIFYVHGATIIQRTFLSLIPFFVLIMASAVEEVSAKLKFRHLPFVLYIANVIFITISFVSLLNSSKQNNELSIHEHDLRNHYYLINFNARDVTKIAGDMVKNRGAKLYVWDDYGETGLRYYLNRYEVLFEWFEYETSLHSRNIILTNNQKEIERFLNEEKISFIKVFKPEAQYNLYLLKN